MAVTRFMRSGGLAALAAAIAITAIPAQAQDRGQGRWNRGGDAGAQANPGGGGDAGRGNADGNRGGWRGNGGDGQQRGWSRGGDGNRGGWRGRAEAPVQTQPQTPAPAPQAQVERRGWAQGSQDRGQWQGQRQREGQAQVQNRWQGRSPGEVTRNDGWRDADRDRQRAAEANRWQNDGNRYRNDNRWRDDANRYRSDNRWQGDRRNFGGNWNRDWRRDNRYDWRGYRDANRNIFRLNPYYAPYRNYSYRRLSPGFRLEALFFGSRYWILDPWQYRLPPADGPFRWVRYYDDALLVDIYTGEVVDVLYDFFW